MQRIYKLKPATQDEVNNGINNYRYVTPETLENKPSLGPVYIIVQNYAALPAPSTVAGKVYLVLDPQGTWLLGTKKRAGLYHSNGIIWKRLGNLPIDDSTTTTENLWSALKVDTEVKNVLTGSQTVNTTIVNLPAYTLDINDFILHVIYTITGIVTITLPTAQALSGRYIVIKDGGNNAKKKDIIIQTEGAEQIEFANNAIINSDGASINLYSDGADWFVW